jgi:hypothetical protein
MICWWSMGDALLALALLLLLLLISALFVG